MKEQEDCRCPNLLAGHWPTCPIKRSGPGNNQKISEEPIIAAIIPEALGPFSNYAKDALLYAVWDTAIEQAKLEGIPYTSKIDAGDLIFVKEFDNDELSEYRNVFGSWIGIVVDLYPISNNGDEAEADEFQALIVDPLGNQVNPGNYWLTGNDQVYILRRNLQVDSDVLENETS